MTIREIINTDFLFFVFTFLLFSVFNLRDTLQICIEIKFSYMAIETLYRQYRYDLSGTKVLCM